MSSDGLSATDQVPQPSVANPHTNGLIIERVFSGEGANPLDSVEWELRDAVIKNPSGEAVFQQTNVEFPKCWSPLATNVVASKYFYGDNATPHLDPDEGGVSTPCGS